MDFEWSDNYDSDVSEIEDKELESFISIKWAE